MVARSGREAAVYIISVAAELAGVHPQTLRTYERKGLIRPSRTSGGTRRYSERDVERVQLIQELTQEEGINLAGVLRILRLEEELERAEERLAEAHEEIERVKREAREALREQARRRSSEIVLYREPVVDIEPHPVARRRRR